MADVVIEGLTCRYGDVTAVDDVSLTIADGEFLTLLGPSGCGKSTTLAALAGLDVPHGGASRRRRGLLRRGQRDATCRRSSATAAWCSSPTRSGRT